MNSFLIRFGAAALCALLPFVNTGSTHAASGSQQWHVLGAAAALPTLYKPSGLTLDAKGDAYIADSGNFRVVEVGPTGRLLAHFGEADLRPIFRGPQFPPQRAGEGVARGPVAHSLALDARGYLYVADPANGYVRVFSPQHHLVTDWPIFVIGSSIVDMAVASGPGGNIIVAIAAQLACNNPDDTYCAGYYIVQRRSRSGVVLGQFHSPIGASGVEAAPPVITSIATAIDSHGNIYVAQQGALACYKSCPSFNLLIKHRWDGKVEGRWGYEGLASYREWRAIAIGPRDSLYLADSFNHVIEKRNSKGKLIKLWSLGLFPHSTAFAGIALDRQANMYVSDPGNGRVVKASSGGRVLTHWGTGGVQPGRFWFPAGSAVDRSGRLWVADTLNARIQARGKNGGFRVAFKVPGLGPALTLDGQGNLLVAQLLSNHVFLSKFSQRGRLLARWGGLHLAELPSGIAVGPSGEIRVVGLFYFNPANLALDREDVLRLSRTGSQLGLYRLGNRFGRGGMGVDAQGNSFIAYGNSIEKRADGTLLASWPYTTASPLNTLTQAALSLDSAGDVYVADTSSDLIQEFSPTGGLLRRWGSAGSYPGQFHDPDGIAVSSSGAIHVADTGNQRIQAWQP